MCLVALAWQVDPANPLLLLANRDEFFERPSAAMSFWEDQPEIVAGRDLRAGGTWLGFHRKNRRLAVITNVREVGVEQAEAERSRGFLIPDFLLGSESAAGYAERLLSQANPQYDGYNLLLFDQDEALCVSNRGGIERLPAGVHGLSNAGLNTPWPKVERVKIGLSAGLAQGCDIAQLEQVFRHAEHVEDEALPSTGIPLEWERKLSAVFIDGDPVYGTRALSSVRMAPTGEVQLREWSRASLEDNWQLVEFEA